MNPHVQRRTSHLRAHLLALIALTWSPFAHAHGRGLVLFLFGGQLLLVGLAICVAWWAARARKGKRLEEVMHVFWVGPVWFFVFFAPWMHRPTEIMLSGHEGTWSLAVPFLLMCVTLVGPELLKKRGQPKR
jgi:hypothetical protein